MLDARCAREDEQAVCLHVHTHAEADREEMCSRATSNRPPHRGQTAMKRVTILDFMKSDYTIQSDVMNLYAIVQPDGQSLLSFDLGVADDPLLRAGTYPLSV